MLAAGEEGSGIVPDMSLKQIHGIDLHRVDSAARIGEVLPRIQNFTQQPHRFGFDLSEQAGSERQRLVAARTPGAKIVTERFVPKPLFQANVRPLRKIEGRAKTPGTLRG
jgi:hypothetical protein